MGTRKLKRFEDGTRAPCWYPFWNGHSWLYDFYVEGVRLRSSTGVCDPEALEVAITISEGLHDAAWKRALSPFPTFEEAAELYLADIGRNRTHVERLVDYFGPFVRIDEIDAFRIKQCKVDLSKPEWTSTETARRHITTPLKAILNYAVGARPEARDETGRTRILTPEEAERLIRAAMHSETIDDPDRRLLKMIAFLLGGGATPGEMFCVRAEDVNRATGEVWIRGKETGAGKTPYRRRMLRLPQRAWDLIGDLPREGRVFLTPRGKEWVPNGERGPKCVRQFGKLCVAAGLNREVEVSKDDREEDDGYEKLVFYSLRHTWATWFSAQVGDQDLLVDRGGWASADTARHYREQVTADFSDRLLAHGWDFRT
jgi:integrase